ncbi:uncharacterized protein HMPREF1541_04469 [Cyphellophora europaea CBS 101466]|uniref:Uncharacterized protein n=1 Tax=Cyphellophora europaea (strain CBS 101466) TaxID=1220924 RepID=W2RWN2_CYPE1|nr:uncharacterized protein HMPREF1541_04469 [Cyphellophora europaea CBS 101466]ETN40193.1 hypothetical protein HMPREF1541_04469 [Cyphellophora europaea CBS 101466]
MPDIEPGSRMPSSRTSRASLRAATFIDPDSGERLNRKFTLHEPPTADATVGQEEDVAEHTPLLPRRASEPRQKTWLRNNWYRTQDAARKARDFAVSPVGIGILKYSLAYLLASMGTFVPWLRALFGRSDTKHTVATVAVYFHPSRSEGSMLEALIYAFSAFAYTAVVSVVSMGIAVFFEDKVHLLTLGHALILVFFVGGGLGFVAWVKLKLGDPLVNVACSLASLTLITILTKEGSVQEGDFNIEKISQILRMVIGGVIASVLVCFTVFPTSARRKIKQNMVDTTDCLSDMLAIITSSFISGDESELEGQALVKVSERHRKSINTLAQNLKESKYEHYVRGHERQSWFEQRLATCIQRLSQSIGGLRSTAATQFVVIKQTFPSYSGMHRRLGSWASVPPSPYSHGSRNHQFGYINEVLQSPQPNADPGHVQDEQPFRTPSQIFDIFMDHLGPSMRSLAFTLKEILDDLPFDPEQHYAITFNPKFKISLQRAMELYKNARSEALHAIYDKNMYRQRPMEVQADWEEAAACCGHFSTSLIDVAEDVQEYLIILDEMQEVLAESHPKRTWSWLKFWQKPPRDQPVKEDNALFLSKPSEADLQLRTHEKSSAEVPAGSPWKALKRLYFRKLYDSLYFLRREDVKYAIKVGFGAVLYALPSFLRSTRSIYQHWRGEWGLLSYMLVCSMTIGASNTTGYSRIWGTCLGAIMAIIAWSASNGDPYVLAVFGFAMAYWTGYITIARGKGPMGRFIMLTYNLSALYAYSLSVQDEDDDGDEEDKSKNPLMWPIVSHRVTSVIVGCVWGLIITRLVWPISARQKLKEGLSLIWLRMGLIWKRDPLTVLLEGDSPHPYMNLTEEFKLQRYVRKLQNLVESAKSEFELRGPFPHSVYSKIVNSTVQMLDVFHEMNTVLPKQVSPSPGLEALLQATRTEREQLCSRISHLFSVLASSMKLEFPLATDALPSIDHTRDRLLARIFAYRQSNVDSEQTSDEDFSVVYAYALATGQLAQEIQNVLKEVENLFGVLDEEALRLQ